MIFLCAIRRTASRVSSTLLLGGVIATAVSLLGTRDLEGYDVSFFSLNRGTALETVTVLGQPVYTLGLGLGVRLPLHGSLGASPAAALAPDLPAPLTYWLVLALAIAMAAILVRHALVPLAGPLVSWLALALLFWSPPIVGYTIYNDWPENAITYPAFVACVFAPQALLTLIASSRSANARRLGALAVAGVLWALIAAAHPGHWPLLATSLVLAWLLALLRLDHPLRARLTMVAGLAAASLAPVLLQAPDILRELYAAGAYGAEMKRLVEGASGNLLYANAYPLGQVGPRLPFTLLVLTVVSLLVGLTSKDAELRRTIVGAAVISMLLSVGAATLPAGTAPYTPSIGWGLRDPAIAFAVLSASCAAAAVRRSRRPNGIVRPGVALMVLMLAGLQGPAYAAALVRMEPGGHSFRWNQDMTTPQARAVVRGLSPEQVHPGTRLALWPGVRQQMRNIRQSTADFADAGYRLVTAWTKDRTMRGLVEPNELFFSQSVELSPAVLCSTEAVRFLQLRYLLLPSDVQCAPWTRLDGLRIDGWLDVAVAPESDDRIRTFATGSLDEGVRHAPALSAGSTLLQQLTPLPGTSVAITSRGVNIRLETPSLADGRALVLPLAYDPAWRASSGHLHNVGGLLALADVDQRQISVEFIPDAVAVLRAVSMIFAQFLAVGAFLTLAAVGWRTAPDALNATWLRERAVRIGSRLISIVRPRDWVYLGYAGGLGLHVASGPSGLQDSGLVAGSLLPVVALGVANLAQRERVHRAMGTGLWAVALIALAAAGSRAPEALRDPLFWALLAVLGVAVSAGVRPRRYQGLSWTAAAVAGACTMVATLVPFFLPATGHPVPDGSVAVVRHALGTFSGQLGPLATLLLLACWGQAIAGGSRIGSTGRIDAATRGALLAGLVLVVSGAVPQGGIDTEWMTVLGILLGLTEANARSRRPIDVQAPSTISG